MTSRDQHLSQIARAARVLRDQTRNLLTRDVTGDDDEALVAWRKLDLALNEHDLDTLADLAR